MATSVVLPGAATPTRTIRILFYTDCRDSNYKEVPQPGPGGPAQLRREPTEFGLRIAKDLVEAQSGFFVRFKVDVINRHHDYDSSGAVEDYAGAPRVGKNKLTTTLLKHYHQVWFFGQLYANYNTDVLDTLHNYGNRESELTDPEVAALRVWMDAGGGVLMTGDHSNFVGAVEDTLADPSLRGKQLNLGRAIGHRVPRAGQMRVWVGDPGAFRETNYVVDTADDTDDMVWMRKQEDATPQSVRIAKIGHRVGIGSALTQFFFYEDYHPLFKAAPTPSFPGSVIDVLPDHVHEGAVEFPSSYPEADWPRRNRVQPKPQPVAWGTNWATRNRTVRDPVGAIGVLRVHPEVVEVSAYDGDLVGIGRIVAHSTWHHFVNVNLVGFRNQDGSPGPVLDRIGTYYGNLALWLSPWHERASIIFDATKWIREHPLVREVHGGPPRLVGRTAAQVLSKGLGVGPYSDLMQLALLDLQDGRDSSEGAAPGFSLPDDLILGHAIEVLSEEARRDKAGMNDPFRLLRTSAARAMRSMERSFAATVDGLRQAADALEASGHSQGPGTVR